MAVLTIGLTGGIASGKSLLADAFAALGAPVLDGDQVARDIVRPGTPALAEIFATFGAKFRQPDGTLDRRKLREHVFGNAAERRRLEQVTHPRIRQGLLDWRDAQSAPYCILAVPILVESGLDALVDRILVVDAPEELQMQRLQARDGVSATLARQMLDAQAPRSQRLERAHDVVRNDSDPAVAQAAARRLDRFYRQLAQAGERKAPGLKLP